MPARICKHPGCGRTTREKYCERHSAGMAGEKTSAERGYDHRWRKVRETFLRTWLAERGPWCGACGCRLTGGQQTHVDHVVPFDGLDDPLRLSVDNLQVLCDSCNAVKARRQAG